MLLQLKMEETTLMDDYSDQILLRRCTGLPSDRQFFQGPPFPVTIAWTKIPNMGNMASLPFLISLTLSSAKALGSSASPSGSKLPPGYSGSVTSPRGPPAIR